MQQKNLWWESLRISGSKKTTITNNHQLKQPTNNHQLQQPSQLQPLKRHDHGGGWGRRVGRVEVPTVDLRTPQRRKRRSLLSDLGSRRNEWNKVDNDKGLLYGGILTKNQRRNMVDNDNKGLSWLRIPQF